HARRRRGACELPPFARRSSVVLSRSLSGALAVSELPFPLLFGRGPQPVRRALPARELHERLAPDGGAGGDGAGAPYRHLEYDHSEARASAARCEDPPGGERNGAAPALPATRTFRVCAGPRDRADRLFADWIPEPA